ncbi:hypothetical protein G7K_5571-t1 [Saitoella complicata NRRL Y-17804]|uniref:Uncharacterized protein n=1 Tax=Saitoella complicata (strain BCRC 22490 / CBS 7301 / JCM 7358 / NBRC 10748 / NRRL Y-17804) TaxID=698492 RepID=A0A0E9NP77_SAICN|nr:hypothetical protein G7K_5571-t1 [Saitoella complicata NRRL Y-17804]
MPHDKKRPKASVYSPPCPKAAIYPMKKIKSNREPRRKTHPMLHLTKGRNTLFSPIQSKKALQNYSQAMGSNLTADSTLGGLLNDLLGLLVGSVGLGLQLGLLNSLLLLRLLSLRNSLSTGRRAGLRALGPLLLDHIHGSTNNGTLSLDGTAGTLLLNLDLNTLLVHATVENGPGDLAGVLALEEEGGVLGGLEAEDLGVTADVELTRTGVDLGAGESALFDLHL